MLVNSEYSQVQNIRKFPFQTSLKLICEILLNFLRSVKSLYIIIKHFPLFDFFHFKSFFSTVEKKKGFSYNLEEKPSEMVFTKCFRLPIINTCRFRYFEFFHKTEGNNSNFCS